MVPTDPSLAKRRIRAGAGPPASSSAANDWAEAELRVAASWLPLRRPCGSVASAAALLRQGQSRRHPELAGRGCNRTNGATRSNLFTGTCMSTNSGLDQPCTTAPLVVHEQVSRHRVDAAGAGRRVECVCSDGHRMELRRRHANRRDTDSGSVAVGCGVARLRTTPSSADVTPFPRVSADGTPFPFSFPPTRIPLFHGRFRTSAPVSKTGMGGFVHRGFESLPLR